MSEENDRIRQELLENDDDFRKLANEHEESERRLEELNQASLRSPEAEAEEKRLKLHKLHLKDQMELLLREQREAHASV